MKLTKIQREMLKKKCPACEISKLHEVKGETEIVLWCDNCDCSVDSSGGYTN